MRTLFLIFLLSCSHERQHLLKAWEGREISELEGHPVFSKVPYKEKEVAAETIQRNYQESGKYRTKASCAGLGGCLGLPSGACQNIFTIEKGIIKKYEMRESCLTEKAKLPSSLDQ